MTKNNKAHGASLNASIDLVAKLGCMTNAARCLAAITAVEHEATQREIWETCGSYTTIYQCSCGYIQTASDGKGCWQENHNMSENIDGKLDAIHKHIAPEMLDPVGPPQ